MSLFLPGTPDNQPFPAVRKHLSRLARLTLKELREILRDRRTIITLVLMPLMLYPLLSIAFQKLLLTGLGAKPATKYLIGMPDDQVQTIMTCLRLGELETEKSKKPGAEKPSSQPELEIYRTDHLERDVKNFSIDLGIRVRERKDRRLRPDRNTALDFDLVYSAGSSTGAQAFNHVSKWLRAGSESVLRERLKALRISQRVMPFEVMPIALPNLEPGGGSISLASLIPVILILMTITGAVYPAIDLTAGERERGTLETLVAAPVPRLGLLFAKYIAVITVSFLTATVNLVSMTITILSGGLGGIIWGDKGLALTTVLEIFALLLLFAAFFSAVLLTLTSFARSFKEAQAYLIPLMIFSISPGLVSLIPGIRLGGWLLITPLLNIALLSRDLLEGNADPASAAVVVFSTILFALAAIALAARNFGSENVLYDAQVGWSDLFRRATQMQTAPRVSSALFCLALMFPACFLLTNTVARLDGISTELKLGLMSAGTALIFGIFPIVAAIQGGVSWTSGFRCRAPAPLTLPLAMLLGFSLWPFAFELTVAMHEFGFTTISTEHSAQVKGLVERFRTLSPVTVVFALAVVPAVFEEFFFRGYLFSAFLRETKPSYAILGSAAFFGLFHLITTDALAVERLLPTTFLGLVLGWISWKTGSIFPGMLLHCCHNGFLTLVAFYERQLSAQGWGGSETKHLPMTWLLAAAAGCSIGLGLLQILCRNPEEPPPE